jgi:hypothetical protein
MRLSGTRRQSAWLPFVRISGPPFPDCHGKAREEIGPLLGLEPKGKRIVLVPDFAEETLVFSSAAVSLGAGLVVEC